MEDEDGARGWPFDTNYTAINLYFEVNSFDLRFFLWLTLRDRGMWPWRGQRRWEESRQRVDKKKFATSCFVRYVRNSLKRKYVQLQLSATLHGRILPP